jgi:hypothetical protein
VQRPAKLRHLPNLRIQQLLRDRPKADRTGKQAALAADVPAALQIFNGC